MHLKSVKKKTKKIKKSGIVIFQVGPKWAAKVSNQDYQHFCFCDWNFRTHWRFCRVDMSLVICKQQTRTFNKMLKRIYRHWEHTGAIFMRRFPLPLSVVSVVFVFFFLYPLYTRAWLLSLWKFPLKLTCIFSLRDEKNKGNEMHVQPSRWGKVDGRGTSREIAMNIDTFTHAQNCNDYEMM